MEKVNIEEKLECIKEYWRPGIIGELNGQYVKVAKLKGTFVWHAHENEDELFYVLHGSLKMEFRDKTEILNSGDMIVVPKGVEHRPVAENEVSIMLFEPKDTVNTGNVENNLTIKDLDFV